MKTVSPSLTDHLGGALTTLAELIKITRRDGVIKAFTTHDAPVTLDGVTYEADGAFTPGAMTDDDGLEARPRAIEGLIDSATISADDLAAGLYDHARIDVFVCNWADPSMGAVHLRRGWLGDVTIEDERYVAALHGLHDQLQRRVGDSFTPGCRHALGDAGCGVNLAALTVTGTVTASTGRASFVDVFRGEPDDTFAYGALTWTSGGNQGLAMEVQGWNATTRTMTLWMPMPHAIQTGDAYTVTPGCDKRFVTCAATFANSVNFGGFPHLPGLSAILDYPDAR